MGLPVNVVSVVSRMFGQNCFLIGLEGGGDCVVVDPGFDAEEIQATILQQKWVPRAILNTHGHFDHIAGNQFLKRCWPDCPLVIGTNEAFKLTDPEANLSSQLGAGMTSPMADQLVEDGEVLEIAGLSFTVLEIPGHSIGHVVYLCKTAEPWIMAGGDVLFQGGIGRTDFPDGDTNALFASIRQKLYPLPPDTIVLPGHGPATTIGEERTTNPFVRAD